MKNYVCSICGEKYESLDDYLACVAKCGEKLKAEQKAEAEKERLEKVNAALNGIKEAKKYYEDQLEKFKEDYPAEYKLNFGDRDTYNFKDVNDCTPDDKSNCKGYVFNPETKSVKVMCEKKNDEEPVIKMKVNGKDVSADKLFDDPDCRYIAKLLGLV
jgi:DNA-directed RNA polymerase subunit RPC12/RpoP